MWLPVDGFGKRMGGPRGVHFEEVVVVFGLKAALAPRIGGFGKSWVCRMLQFLVPMGVVEGGDVEGGGGANVFPGKG